jgi:steroid delta-isomerase-like uncharacterized protein
MSAAAVKDVVRRSFEYISNGDMDSYKKQLTDDYVLHDQDEEHDIRGKQASVDYFEQYREAFPDMKVTIDGDMIVDGDKCVTRWTARGTHEGKLFGIAPTHKQVAVHGMEIDRVKNGKVAETWQTWDSMGLFQQLGKMPKETAMAGR